MCHCVLLQGLQRLLQTNYISSTFAAATPAVAAATAVFIVQVAVAAAMLY